MPMAGVLSNFFLLFCAGNAGGSYLTIMSSGGLQFGILQIIGSFGNVWADQAYWQVRHSWPLSAEFCVGRMLEPKRTLTSVLHVMYLASENELPSVTCSAGWLVTFESLCSMLVML